MLSEAEQIEAIYAIYPRKVGKRAAIKAIEKAIVRIATHHGDAVAVGIDLQPLSCRRWLYKRTAEYAASPAGQKPPDPAHDFRPHPSTWFNQERFFDDPAEWQKPNGSRNGKASTASAEQIARANARIVELAGHSLRAR